VVVRDVVAVSVNALLVEIVAVVSAPTKVIAAEETRHGPALTLGQGHKVQDGHSNEGLKLDQERNMNYDVEEVFLITYIFIVGSFSCLESFSGWFIGRLLEGY